MSPPLYTAELEQKVAVQRKEIRELVKALQETLDRLHQILYFDSTPFEMSSPYPLMEDARKSMAKWQDKVGDYEVSVLFPHVALAAVGEDL